MQGDIPVTFNYKGNEYKGFFSQVSGSGSTAMFHLNVNGYHWGQLSYVQGHDGFNGGPTAVKAGWRFASNQHPELEEMADYFGDVVIAWFQ